MRSCVHASVHAPEGRYVQASLFRACTQITADLKRTRETAVGLVVLTRSIDARDAWRRQRVTSNSVESNRAMHIDRMYDPNVITDTNGTALPVADAFRDILDAARRRRREITTCNAIGFAYLTET